MMDERKLIERYFMRPEAGASASVGASVGIVVGIGDDAAVLDCGDEHLVVTADTLVEGRHFDAAAAAEDVGHKALAVGLSDIAAMGAVPRWATLCLSLPACDDTALEHWVGEFARGFFALAQRWDVALVGGDLVRGPRTVTVQLGGGVSTNGSKTLLRSGARPGDGVYLTGDVGDAGFAWRHPDRLASLGTGAERCLQKLHRPEPRVAEGEIIAGFASAAMDVSDGLLHDVSQLARASDVTIEIEVENVPIGEGCRALCRSAEDWALPLTGGDDYELLFTMSDEQHPALERALTEAADCAPPVAKVAQVARIGRVADASEERLRCTFEGADWPLPPSLGFDHFSAR